MPYQVVKDFEKALCDYTGARYAVTTTSCTMALLLACAWELKGHSSPLLMVPGDENVKIDLKPGGLTYYSKDSVRIFPGGITYFTPPFEIPSRTYVGVPQSIIHAGGKVTFRDYPWLGWYQLAPYPIFDCARRFTSNMYDEQAFQCVSFHWSKILGLGQGGAILHDDEDADIWLRRMRFDGRTEGVSPTHDNITEIGYHAYMSPETAAQGLMRLKLLPRYNEDLPNSDYPDLSKMEIFR